MSLTPFETFYVEKRPFSLEGMTIFDYKFDHQNLFYSRRIEHSNFMTVRTFGDHYVKSPDVTRILSAARLSRTTSKGHYAGLIQRVMADEFTPGIQ